MNLSIACADVGSEASDNFGWAVCDVPGRCRFEQPTTTS